MGHLLLGNKVKDQFESDTFGGQWRQSRSLSAQHSELCIIASQYTCTNIMIYDTTNSSALLHPVHQLHNYLPLWWRSVKVWPRHSLHNTTQMAQSRYKELHLMCLEWQTDSFLSGTVRTCTNHLPAYTQWSLRPHTLHNTTPPRQSINTYHSLTHTDTGGRSSTALGPQGWNACPSDVNKNITHLSH